MVRPEEKGDLGSQHLGDISNRNALEHEQVWSCKMSRGCNFFSQQLEPTGSS
jgi:hypothetical protein